MGLSWHDGWWYERCFGNQEDNAAIFLQFSCSSRTTYLSSKKTVTVNGE
jgi:hypothetical protein